MKMYEKPVGRKWRCCIRTGGRTDRQEWRGKYSLFAQQRRLKCTTSPKFNEVQCHETKYDSRIFNLAVRVSGQLHAPVPFCPLLYWVQSVFVLSFGTLWSNNSRDYAYFYVRSCPCGASIKITVLRPVTIRELLKGFWCKWTLESFSIYYTAICLTFDKHNDHIKWRSKSVSARFSNVSE